MTVESGEIVSEKPYTLCFETLSNDLRLKILSELSAKPLSVSELSKKLGAEQSRLSHSLQMLRTCNYVAVESKGKQRIYRLNPVIEGGLELKKSRANVFEYMDSHIMTCCNNHCNKLVQLK